jgi:Protein of unknown function (DUF3716)
MAPSRKRKRQQSQSPPAPSLRSSPPVGRSLRPRTVTPAAAPAPTTWTFKAINMANPAPSAAATVSPSAATPRAYGSPNAGAATTPRAYSPPSAPATPKIDGSGSAAVTPGASNPLSAAPATPPTAAPPAATAAAAPSAAAAAPSAAAAAPSAAAAAPPAPAATAWNPLDDLPPFDKKVSGAFAAFSRRPAARRPILRDENRQLLLSQQSNREAYLAQCVGVVSPTPCGHCAKDDGPWDQCVSVPGFLVGSCANCHYGGEGTRCSLRGSKFILFFINFG